MQWKSDEEEEASAKGGVGTGQPDREGPSAPLPLQAGGGEAVSPAPCHAPTPRAIWEGRRPARRGGARQTVAKQVTPKQNMCRLPQCGFCTRVVEFSQNTWHSSLQHLLSDASRTSKVVSFQRWTPKAEREKLAYSELERSLKPADSPAAGTGDSLHSPLQRARRQKEEGGSGSGTPGTAGRSRTPFPDGGGSL